MRPRQKYDFRGVNGDIFRDCAIYYLSYLDSKIAQGESAPYPSLRHGLIELLNELKKHETFTMRERWYVTKSMAEFFEPYLLRKYTIAPFFSEEHDTYIGRLTLKDSAGMEYLLAKYSNEELENFLSFLKEDCVDVSCLIGLSQDSFIRDELRVFSSKRLAKLLRHDRCYKYDIEGWREVIDLINNHGFTQEELKDIVDNDPKGRYEFSQDGTLIRARYGHTVPVIVAGATEATPPDILYHGTASRNIVSIMKEGIKRMNRNFVHLSTDYDIALSVGARHGESVVLKINSKQMHSDGVRFRVTTNGVWLTEFVDSRYVKIQ